MQKEEKSIVVFSTSSFGKKEKALLAGLVLPHKRRRDTEDSLEELKRLAETGGITVCRTEMVKRNAPAANFYIGRGKAEEIAGICAGEDADMVIFDDNLSPVQVKNLQELCGLKVIDRTELILSIFAVHAESREGRIQIRLAQLEYMLPRLAHAWPHLSRQWGGGAGARGPGERQLELDRRRVRREIKRLKKELVRVHSRRKLQRKRRERLSVPLVSVIGYTNAGKTTLFNLLTDSFLPAEDKLFTTLDPKLKRYMLPGGKVIVLSDTVGFINNLPHLLVESFKATLEEVYEADMLLHVIDAGVPGKGIERQYEVVLGLLKELGVISRPRITVLNKIDLVPDISRIKRISADMASPVFVSAKEGIGINALIRKLDRELAGRDMQAVFFIPSECSAAAAGIYRAGRVIKSEYTGSGVRLEAEIPSCSIGKFKKWMVKDKRYEK